MASEILIVDDEADIRDLVAGILEDEGFVTRTARDSDTALAEIANRRPHLVFLDIWLQGSKLDGLQLLEQVKQAKGEPPQRPGAGEEARAGTLCIDEIADMPRETKNKVFRALVEQSVQRVGGAGEVQVDVRIISSTARNLEEEIAAGHFREDLYHRLSVVPIRVPPLSERREDIPELIDYFMDQISSATGLPKRQIGQDAMAVLQSHVWPGNVRQLRNNVERVMILAGGGPEVIITADMLPQDVGSMVPAMPTSSNGEHIMGLPLREAREVFERDYLIAQISRFSGNISRTAEFVGMERSALHRKLKALGVG